MKKGRISESKQLVEDCITAHNTGSPIDSKYLKQFHIILWDQATKTSDQSEYNEAILWYNYSLSLFSPDGEKDKNVAKLQVLLLLLYP